MGFVTYGRVELEHVVSEIEDLDKLKRAVTREDIIRTMVAETGEPREIVAQMFDANDSMAQEGVLELTEGEPTTLADALTRYVDALDAKVGEGSTLGSEAEDVAAEVVSELTALLAYPWPDSAAPQDAEALTREIHQTYLRLAPRFGVEMTEWDALEEYQRGLALAVVADLVTRGVRQVGRFSEDHTAPCPVCQATGGFHDDDAHRAARDAIPAHLTRPGNKVARRAGGSVPPLV